MMTLAGQGVLVAGALRRAAADRHGYHAVRVVGGRTRRSRVTRLDDRQGGLAVALHAFRIRPVQRQAGEELGRHAPAAARIERPAGPAGSPGLRLAQAGEQRRLAPYHLEAAWLPDVPGQEVLVDGERAGVYVTHGIDEAYHAPRPAHVQPGQRLPVGRQVEERVPGEHLLAVG